MAEMICLVVSLRAAIPLNSIAPECKLSLFWLGANRQKISRVRRCCNEN